MPRSRLIKMGRGEHSTVGAAKRFEVAHFWNPVEDPPRRDAYARKNLCVDSLLANASGYHSVRKTMLAQLQNKKARVHER